MSYLDTGFGKLLEGMVDHLGMEKMLIMLAAVCDAKATKIILDSGDQIDGDKWTDFAVKLEKLATESKDL